LDSTNHVIREVEYKKKKIADNTWQYFSFEPILASKGKHYWFCFENLLKNEAVTLWTNNEISGICQQNGSFINEAICFKCHYAEKTSYVLDNLIFKNQTIGSSLPLSSQEELHNIIHYCVKTQNLDFLRLAHLADAFGKAQAVKKVLSVGCGAGYQEAFLAGRFPDIQVDATDIYLTQHNFSFLNLNFSQLDILAAPDEGDYDFVMSIECLEHIEDYRLAFRNIAKKVKLGKYLYISVPFASEEEQQDEVLKQQEWETNQHYLPGFTFRDLESMFQENGFQIIHSSNMFGCALVNNINGILNKLDTTTIENSLTEIVLLFLLDINGRKVRSRKEGEVGIRFLGQKIA
jgi:SAM-dependent methyltransferase